MAGADKYVKRLMDDGHDVMFVTAREGPVSIPETLKWMKKNLPFVNKKQLVFMYEKHKLPADVLIDDRTENLAKYQEYNQDSICMGIKYPYSGNVGHLIDYGPDAWEYMYWYLRFNL
jgi:predicted secreted acid phosphatase